LDTVHRHHLGIFLVHKVSETGFVYFLRCSYSVGALRKLWCQSEVGQNVVNEGRNTTNIIQYIIVKFHRQEESHIFSIAV